MSVFVSVELMFLGKCAYVFDSVQVLWGCVCVHGVCLRAHDMCVCLWAHDMCVCVCGRTICVCGCVGTGWIVLECLGVSVCVCVSVSVSLGRCVSVSVCVCVSLRLRACVRACVDAHALCVCVHVRASVLVSVCGCDNTGGQL